MQKIDVVNGGPGLTNQVEEKSKLLQLFPSPRRIEHENPSSPFRAEHEGNGDQRMEGLDLLQLRDRLRGGNRHLNPFAIESENRPATLFLDRVGNISRKFVEVNLF